MIISLGLQAQNISIPTETVLETIGDTSFFIGVYPSNPTGESDEYGYTTTTYPPYFTMDVIDNLWDAKSLKSTIVKGDTLFVPQRTKYFSALKNRYGVALNQNVKIKVYRIIEKSNPIKFWYLYEYGNSHNIPETTFWNHSQVDSVVHPENYIVIDTTITIEL